VSDPPEGDPVVVAIDEQDDVPVDLERWRLLARAALREEGVGRDSEMTLLFVDEQTMAELNETHMHSEGPTDVLSFPIDGIGDEPPGADEPTGPREATPDLPRMVGDVVICPTVAERNAPEHAGSYDDEVALLVIHGVLHLLGHDHAMADARERMRGRERALLAAHYGPLADDPWRD
jgi:probable rRNA maturation factor